MAALADGLVMAGAGSGKRQAIERKKSFTKLLARQEKTSVSATDGDAGCEQTRFSVAVEPWREHGGIKP